jgi:hypothetical protein
LSNLPNNLQAPQALYYPFHLCATQTLERLLKDYSVVHFRDYMALQLTATTGTAAYADRMGHYHEAYVREGRIVQGYSVSGPLDAEMERLIDKDLADTPWRCMFDEALRVDRRFQRGLFDLSHGMRIGRTVVPGPAALLELAQDARRAKPYTVAAVRELSRDHGSLPIAYDFEYGLALVKTAAALLYTVRLCQAHRLQAVTDSASHHRLLERTRQREQFDIRNHCVDGG